jgi:hypothetical protein
MEKETDEAVVKRIRKRERRAENGPWKWQLLDALNRIEAKLDKLGAQSDTTRKLSEAGKKSAAIRMAKFGSARPPVKAMLDAFAGPQMDLVPESKIERPFPDPVHEGVRGRTKKQPIVTDGGIVWQAYDMAYRNRYGVAPLRNAKVNAQCKELAKQIGVERATQVACYYVERNDAFYVNAKHPLGLCVLNLQKLVTERETNTVVTMTDARRVESHSQTDRAIREYASRQEGVREQVHVKGVENADS